MASLYDKESMQCVKVYEKKLLPGKHKLVMISAHASPANLDAIEVK